MCSSDLAFCREHQLDEPGDEANYRFLAHELKTSEKRTVPALKATDTIEEAVKVFLETFERAGVSHEESRLRWAKRALQAFG